MKPHTLPFQKLRLCRNSSFDPTQNAFIQKKYIPRQKKTPTGNSQHNAFNFPYREVAKVWANKRQIPSHLQYPTSLVCPNPLISLGGPWHQIGALQSVIVPRISTDICVSAWSWCDLSLWVVLVQGRKPTRTPNNVTPERNIKQASWNFMEKLLRLFRLPYKETMSWFPLKAYTLDLVLSTFRPHRG